MSTKEGDAPEGKGTTAMSSDPKTDDPQFKKRLVLHTDGINTSAPWRLADYGETVAAAAPPARAGRVCRNASA